MVLGIVEQRPGPRSSTVRFGNDPTRYAVRTSLGNKLVSAKRPKNEKVSVYSRQKPILVLTSCFQTGRQKLGPKGSVDVGFVQFRMSLLQRFDSRASWLG